MRNLKLICRTCGRTDTYDRALAPEVPGSVVTLEHAKCDRCDDGDFSTERWLDVEGREVVPV